MLTDELSTERERYAILTHDDKLCVRRVLLDEDGDSVPGRVRVFDLLSKAHRHVAMNDLTVTAKSAEQRLAMLVICGLRPLRVYHDADGSGSNWVIAYSAEDAAEAYADSIGEYMHEEYGSQLWEPIAATFRLRIWCDSSDGMPTEPGGSDAVEVELTCGEWVSRMGRGFLCTSEY